VSRDEIERARRLAEQVRRKQRALAELAGQVAEAEERLAATFEQMAEMAPDRAEELLDKAAFSRQIAHIERRHAAQYARSEGQGE